MGSASAYNPKEFTKIYLNGEYVKSTSKETFSVKNPKDNSVVVEGVPLSGPEDVELAVKYAEEAYNGPWSKFTALERTQCFHRLAAILEDKLLDILTLDSLTSGNPVSIIPTREKNYIKNAILYYAGWTDKQKGDYFPADDGMCDVSRLSCGDEL
jgi:acyl-CoA reductase-like NAD-dependent aldehyde dehydrogenase